MRGERTVSQRPAPESRGVLLSSNFVASCIAGDADALDVVRTILRGPEEHVAHVTRRILLRGLVQAMDLSPRPDAEQAIEVVESIGQWARTWPSRVPARSSDDIGDLTQVLLEAGESLHYIVQPTNWPINPVDVFGVVVVTAQEFLAIAGAPPATEPE